MLSIKNAEIPASLRSAFRALDIQCPNFLMDIWFCKFFTLSTKALRFPSSLRRMHSCSWEILTGGDHGHWQVYFFLCCVRRILQWHLVTSSVKCRYVLQISFPSLLALLYLYCGKKSIIWSQGFGKGTVVSPFLDSQWLLPPLTVPIWVPCRMDVANCARAASGFFIVFTEVSTLYFHNL